MNGARGFGGGERRKTDRRPRRGTVRRTAKQKNAPGRGRGVLAASGEPRPAEAEWWGRAASLRPRSPGRGCAGGLGRRGAVGDSQGLHP